MQWSTDVTEPAHITEIKVPSCAMNNQDYESQIMRHLDRAEKCQRFDLATALQDPEDQQAAVRIIEEVANSPDHAEDDAPLIHRLARFLPFQVNYFAQSASLLKGKVPSAPHPYRTFAAEDAAFHLSRDPAYRRVAINDITETFNLPDLSAALAQYAHRLMSGHCTHAIGGGTGYLPISLYLLIVPMFGQQCASKERRTTTHMIHCPHRQLMLHRPFSCLVGCPVGMIQ